MINVKSLKSASLIKTFKSSTVLVNAGESSDKMYIVVKGNAIIYENYRTSQQRITGELNPGDFYGELALFLNKSDKVTIVSLGELNAMEITRNNIYQFFQNDPEAAYLITQHVCQKFDNLNKLYETMSAPSAAQPQSAPQAQPKPQPVPQPVPRPAAPQPQPKPAPQAVSQPAPQPAPQPVPQPAPQPKPQPVPQPAPQPKPQPDAAAQAKLQSKLEQIPRVELQPQSALKSKTESKPQAAKAKTTSVSSLFPNGHKNHYKLPPFEQKDSLILDESLTCPICKTKFSFPHVRTVYLRTLSTDHDLRKTYDGINLTHYLTVTCPECLFSAITDKFSSASPVKKERVLQMTNPYKSDLGLSFEKIDADTIFARLYLALAFTHLCYDSSEMLDGRLWLNISWMYRDCSDLEMEIYAIKKALEAYNTVYERYNLSKKIEQSVCLIVGELNYKLENIEEAKKFFFIAKSNQGGDTDVEYLADDRLSELK